jgi:Xaa-Pro aminopeptidase
MLLHFVAILPGLPGALMGRLEDELVNKKAIISEAAAADKLEGFRSKLDKFMGLSFDTISSTGPNGAIIHYKPEHGTCANIAVNQMYLCDSGGQYLDGTTDVTRTMHFGTPTAEEKDAFTRVLKGHINIDTMIFPHGITGYNIDVVARTSLWQAGLF